MPNINDDLWPQSRSCWGHRGQKGYIKQNRYSFYSLHSMVMWLMHMVNLIALYKSCTQKKYPGSFGVTGVKSSSFFQKFIKMLLLLHFKTYDHVTHIYDVASHPLYSYYPLGQSGVKWGHRGQKVIFTKKFITRLYNIAWSLDLCICNSSRPSTQVWGQRSIKGHLRSRGQKC